MSKNTLHVPKMCYQTKSNTRVTEKMKLCRTFQKKKFLFLILNKIAQATAARPAYYLCWEVTFQFTVGHK